MNLENSCWEEFPVKFLSARFRATSKSINHFEVICGNINALIKQVLNRKES